MRLLANLKEELKYKMEGNLQILKDMFYPYLFTPKRSIILTIFFFALKTH